MGVTNLIVKGILIAAELLAAKYGSKKLRKKPKHHERGERGERERPPEQEEPNA